VLESFYEHPRGDIASALGRLISSPGVEIDAAIHLDALDRYRKTKVHFVDCLITATAADRAMKRSAVRRRDLPRGNLVLEVFRIEAVDSAFACFRLRIHEETDRRATRPGQCDIVGEVVCHPVHFPRTE
jgi:hypothetical protein